ncbi:MAG TPA: AMP-binding protein [Vicinamibacterales bacterium]|jgi:phenylacetate-CoA ligase|nr:AMP-binding protein [Vicinamibacterales bacterium]
MLTSLVELAERLALRTSPQRAVELLGLIPAPALEAMRRARFRRTLRIAAERSPFYREEFRRRGIDVRRIDHPSQLGDFYTTGEDLRSHGADPFVVRRADTAFETTGTTSPVPKRVFFSRREIADMGRLSALWLHLLGLRPDDRVVSAFDCSFWVSPYVLRSGLDLLGSFHVEAGKIDAEEFYDRAKPYRPTVIFGEPSWIVRLSEIARVRGPWPLKFLFAGGENISESARRTVEEAWGAPLYLNYGQTESFGALGAECRCKSGYHRNDLYFFFEVPAADADGYGEVVYTTLSDRVMPLIRYRSSDLTRLVDDPCECGISMGRLAKIRARCDEMVVCGMGNVGPWVFDEVFRGITRISDDWQIVIAHEGPRDAVVAHVEMEDAAGQTAVETRILASLRERFPDFWRNREMRLYELRVIVHPVGSLRGRGRKLRRVIDERQMSARPSVLAV